MANPPTWSNVKALLHFDGSQDSTTIVDSGSTGHAFTCTTLARLETNSTYVKFGTACLNGATYSDYVYAASHADWQFGTGAWTVDFWIYTTDLPASGSAYQYVGNWGTASNSSWAISVANISGTYYLRVLASEDGSAFDNVNIGSFSSHSGAKTHFEVGCDGAGTIYGFVNGSSVGTQSFAYDLYAGTSQLRIGQSLVGYMDEFRLVKGEIVHTSGFTPESTAYEAESVGECTVTVTVSGATTGPEGVGACSIITSAAAIAANIPAISLPITLDVRLPVVAGLPIRIDIYSAVTPTLPISIGQYPVTPTLPIRIDTYIAATLPSLPITIYGDLSTLAAADFVAWKARVVLDGTDISGKLFGTVDIEFDEEAAPVASFSFIPAAGAVDPLVWVSKPVRIYWQSGTAEILVYSGVVSDPQWDAKDRTVSISATGDLQSRLDAMEKTAIATQLGGTFSQYVFDAPENMSGYDYAVARVSTTPDVLWQDAQGAIRSTSVLAKVTPDFTFTEANILDTAAVLQWASRVDITNYLTVTGRYRFKRRRERRKTFVFRPWQLETPSTYLSGNFGGWPLPQRQQIESAANGGGWTVIGDITYTDVWPPGYYSSYSDQGLPMMIGFAITQAVADELCIGARWVGARRWTQAVTETYSMVVTASDSIEAVGTLATDSSFSVDDDSDDGDWESSLDYDDYVSGAILMGNGVDKAADLDTLRADFDTACAVALAKASNDVIKSHRGTTVGFATTFLPHIDLSHTVEVDTTYLECQGKVRRLLHQFDIDAGGATTTIEVAISRHNGSGVASSDTLDPPATPAEPAETAPATYRQLLMHIGGQQTQPVWDESWDGYVVNLPYIEDYQGITGSWSRNPANPQIASRIYDEGFHILPDEIAAEYADPAEGAASQTYDVEIPEDAFVLISG